MAGKKSYERYMTGEVNRRLIRPVVRLQPIQAKEGKPGVNIEALAKDVAGIACLNPVIVAKSPEHWQEVVAGLGPEIDGIVPLSIPCYPTEVWNSHPHVLARRGLPFIFWPIIAFDEPDFWRWSAVDFLKTMGVDAHLVKNRTQGLALLRALGFKRMMKNSSMVVFGAQNFPWNAPAAGHKIAEALGVTIKVRSIADYRAKAEAASEASVDRVLRTRLGDRYSIGTVRNDELKKAVRVYLGIRNILEDERALGFGVNCYGDLIPEGGRDVPCLAQLLLREDGYIASCDGDYLAMTNMLMASHFLDQPSMMSNMYPLSYVGALREHFGDPLSPDETRFPRHEWDNLARLAHCGWVGIVSPEMTPSGKAVLNDWGGTYEIKRDGRGCGIDSELVAGEKVTIMEQKFDGKNLLVAAGEVVETSRYPSMPHCEAAALIRFRNLKGFVDNISREHTVVVYGDHIDDLSVLGRVMGLSVMTF